MKPRCLGALSTPTWGVKNAVHIAHLPPAESVRISQLTCTSSHADDRPGSKDACMVLEEANCWREFGLRVQGAGPPQLVRRRPCKSCELESALQNMSDLAGPL